MWFLEHESLFGNKRVWLRPGAQQLFGRTKSSEDSAESKTWKIDNKAVSRKHVILKVIAPAPEDGTKLHTRSQIEVIDLSCRQGTTIDEKETLKSHKSGDDIIYAKKTLSGTEHTIRLAQGYPPFKLVWRPVVFTYASKETRESKARSAKLHTLDIKTSNEFHFDKTTHVVSAKRNLPKVLTALALAKYVVTMSFLDAIIDVAATSSDEEQNYTPSKLEEDFDAWWPKEKDYIPDVGAEPVPQPQERLLPNSARCEVFSGLTFVFLNDGQYNSLLEPINGGGGKALLYEVRPGETTVQEYVDYIHNVAGKKRRARPDERFPVITVRLPTYPDDMEKWATNFVSGVDQALGQRSVLQNEFLDVIVTNDRASLQRPPTELGNGSSLATVIPSRVSTSASQSRETSQIPEESTSVGEPMKTIPRKRMQRGKTVSRFTGFDDYEPPTKKKKIETSQLEDVQPDAPQTAVASNELQLRAAPSTQSQAPLYETIEKEEQMDSLFPAAATIRRQRAATRVPSASVEPEHVHPTKQKGAEAIERIQRAKAKAERDINVREQTRLRIKEEEDRRKVDEENLREALQGIDIAEMKNLAPIEEMEVLPRQQRSTSHGQSQARSQRWNPEWNGRKNFKKFRRRGVEQGIHGNKLIVTLEEVQPKKGFGIGDAFFLEDAEPSSRVREIKKKRIERAAEDSSSEPEPGFRAQKRSNTQLEVINVEDSGPDDEEEGDEAQPPQERTQRSSGRTQRIAETQLDDQTQTQTQTRGNKRGLSVSTAGQQPASKRGKVGGSTSTSMRRDDDDSDDEETGFRVNFRRRG